MIIPAFNEEKTISQVVDEVKEYGVPLVIDDCSTDQTKDICISKGITVVSHKSNLGYESALQTGFEVALKMGADIVITFDADGQHVGSSIKQILNILLFDETDLVIGIRSSGSSRISEFIFSLYVKMRFGIDDILCGLKGYKMELFTHYGCFDSFNSVGTELALSSIRKGAKYKQIEVPINKRKDGPARFGNLIKGNLRIFRALFFVFLYDISNKWK